MVSKETQALLDAADAKHNALVATRTSVSSMFRGDPNRDPGYGVSKKQTGTLTMGAVLAPFTGGLSLAIAGGIIGQDNRQARKAYEKRVAATAEAVAEQKKRELAAATNQKKAMARARGIELMYKTGMFDAPKWQS